MPETFDAPAMRAYPWWRGALQAALAVCSSLPLLGHIGVAECIAAAAGIGGAAWLARLTAHEGDASSGTQPPVEGADAAGPDSLKRLLAGVLPVWVFHFGSVRSQTEEAVNALAKSLSALSRSFQAAGFAGVGHREEADGGTAGLLTLCESKLAPVVSSMGSILDSKALLVTSILDLSTATKDMRGMADDVARIAQHTNILAINAAIAAAHAGDAGRGFAVIAQEVRQLSQSSAETAKHISERMGQVEEMMSSTIVKADAASAHDRTVIEQSGATIEDVLGHVRQLGENADTMREHGNQIRVETENLLVNLQFQDRVSQISAVLDGDFSRLQEVAEGDGPIPSSDEWLAHLGQLYTMDDQRHPGPSASRPAADTSRATEEVVFF